MMDLAGCLALVIFPASQAPQNQSLVILISSIPRTCFLRSSFCRFLIPVCPSLLCHSLCGSIHESSSDLRTFRKIYNIQVTFPNSSKDDGVIANHLNNTTIFSEEN